MNWFLIMVTIFIVALITSPIVWLLYKAVKNGEFGGNDRLSEIATIKRLEMIDSLYDKSSKD